MSASSMGSESATVVLDLRHRTGTPLGSSWTAMLEPVHPWGVASRRDRVEVFTWRCTHILGTSEGHSHSPKRQEKRRPSRLRYGLQHEIPAQGRKPGNTTP